jgi:two-component system chemotaxis response regulator CheB
MEKIKVLVVDDSALIRQIISAGLSETADIEVIGEAVDPHDAREKIKALNPDVITLDVEMPKMDGISFLSNLMRLRPMPVVMVSTLTAKASVVTLNALELGAVDYIEKPNAGLSGNLDDFTRDLREKVRTAARANVSQLHNAPRKVSKDSAPIASSSSRYSHVVALGASTGGTEAIRNLLSTVPAGGPPIVIAQHIPKNFSSSFAQRLNDACAINAVEAEHNQPLASGTVYVAPGDSHLTIRETKDGLHCWLDQTEKVNRHRPSVDVLFNSVVSRLANHRAIGVLLTGMGNDGAAGLLAMREAGFYTIAQDEATSVVWGMPGAAVKMGAVCEILPLDQIASRLGRVPSARKIAQMMAEKKYAG